MQVTRIWQINTEKISSYGNTYLHFNNSIIIFKLSAFYLVIKVIISRIDFT